MVIFKVLAMCISLAALHLSVPSSAVEFGQDATGDPTAVKVRGASGFLYSERIVITVAHIFGNNYQETLREISRYEREGVIYRSMYCDYCWTKRIQSKENTVSKYLCLPRLYE